MTKPKRQYRFTAFFMVLALTALMIPGALGTLYTFTGLDKSLTAQVDRENTLTLEMVSEKLIYFFHEPVLELQILTKIAATKSDPLTGFELMTQSGHHLQHFQRLLLVDKNADIIGVWPENTVLLGMDQSGKGFLQKIRQSNNAYFWSDTYVDYFTGETATDLVIPLGDGYVAGTVLLGNLQGILDALPQNTDSVIGIVDGKGGYLAHSDRSFVSQRMKDPQIYQPEMSNTGTAATITINGQRYLPYSKPVEGTDWTIVSYYPWEKARAPVNDVLRHVVTTQILMLLGIALLLLLMGRILQKQIRKIEDFTKLIAQGRYNLTEPQATFQEMHHILQHFEDMADKVQDREMEIVAQNEEIFAMNEELESRVHERTLELEAANKELESFSYTVSHDLRTPLRHINGFVGLLKTHLEPAADEKSRHYLSVIGEAATRMEQLITDLLTFSKMGRMEMMTRCVDNNRLVEEIKSALATEAGAKRIKWSINPLPDALGDEEMLRLVWTNLIANAIKFSRQRETPRIEIGALAKGEGSAETVYFIKDNGAGFDMRYKEKLFEIFQRLHRQEDFEGTGVGLANAKRIITRHGGRMWAEGAVDTGAVFYFSLRGYNR